MNEEHRVNNGETPDIAASSPGEEPGEDGRNGRGGGKLPPPAFPPGSRTVRRSAVAPARSEGGDDLPDDAFISPDDPLPAKSSFDEAFISPDEPIVRTHAPEKPDDFEEVLGVSPALDSDWGEVVVTGIGDDPHLGGDEVPDRAPHDPFVEDLLEKVEKLAAGLRQKGEAGLRAFPDMGRFETTLRAYCVGYLAGLREDSD